MSVRTIRIPRDDAGRFINYARTVTSSPSAWREPRSEAELAEVVRDAAREGRRVRVVGAGHSWSAIAAPEEVAVSLDAAQGVVSVDRARGLATVRAGTRLARLNAALADAGLALPIVGSVAAQSIAGAIATGTHGSSLTHGNLASLVHAMRLVDGSGEVVELPAGDARLEGARVHLGALGLVSEVTLRVEPAFRLAETVEDVPVDAVARSLDSLARSAEYVKVWWLPGTRSAQVFRYARTEEPASTRPSPETQRWIDEVVLHGGAFHLLAAAQRWLPAVLPATNRLTAWTQLKPRRVGRSDVMLSTPMPLRHRETEAAVPLARGGEAFDRVLALQRREGLLVNFPIEVRFVRGDAGWMSPAQGADTCQIGAYSTALRDTERFFAAFWRELRAMSARPHWGKEFDHRAEEIRARYPDFERFTALRRELDPAGTFASAFHARALGS